MTGGVAQRPSVLFAGGGSGGHIAPGLAIIERLAELDAPLNAHVVCSTRAIDRTMLEPTGVDFSPIPAAPLRKSPTGFVRFGMRLVSGRNAALGVIDRQNVHLVVALGGFVAGPAVFAARKRKIPAVMLNLDDPPGRANRLLARLCDERWTAVPIRSGVRFPAAVVGMPIRRAALAGDRSPSDCRSALGLDPQRPTLLVTGASQGSMSLNELFTALIERHPEAFASWQVILLAGHRPEAIDAARRASEAAGIPAVIEPFTSEMGLAWGAADLAMSRAGASSAAEAAANAVPTLFLPYPYHTDAHQRRHVEPAVEHGLAWVVDDHVSVERNLPIAGELLRRLLADQDHLAAVRGRLLDHRPPDAALAIARRIIDRLAPTG